MRPVRHERVEHRVELTIGNADASIADRDLHALVVGDGGQLELTLRRLGRAHRIARVDHEIENDLLQLDAVSHDCGNTR